ncbi:hypothetical protein ARMGADRAFT_921104, partial [Armillaria gallica]
LERHFKNMVLAFGFNYHNAPGEAEAELAQMNQVGVIDVIMTEDSDVFVFGAKAVLRQPPPLKGDNGQKMKANPDLYHLFLAECIGSLDSVRVAEGGFFLLAILLGGDYASGLRGCGPTTARMLCQTDLGDSLLAAARTMVDAALDDFLVTWRVRLQSELLQPTVAGASRHPALANKIPADFPSVEVLKYYALPETSWSIGWTPCDATVWEPPLPDISRIMAFCDSFFHWDSDVQLSRFRKQIWPGIIVQSLYRVHVSFY